jgi:hypothetical protein
MLDIDFLPSKYHEAKQQRRTRYWRVIVLLAFGGLLAVAWAGEYGIQLNYEHHLAEVRDQYGVALMQSQQLTKLEQDMKPWQAQAELWTYLRHPWPRSQILRQVLRTLPPQITLSRIATERETVATDPGQPTAPPRTLEEIRAEDAKRLPAERDLCRLRAEIDSTRTVVTLEGLTQDNISLHAYLGRLASQGLFARSELSSLESGDKNHPGVSQFRARLIVRPGYGQPGSGPLLAEGQPRRGGTP